MLEPISILHLSDLHRSKSSPISNAALLASIISDVEKYEAETPNIYKPNVIIISGDIIRGSHDPDEEKSKQEVEGQYAEGLDFLNQLTNNLLEGDKSRIAIIPGNHDVSWGLSKASMQKIDSDQVTDDLGNLKLSVFKDAINTHSDIKWSWKDTSFYKVHDKAMYNRRLEAYADFYSTFYEGKRSFSLNPEEQYDVFDMPDIDLSIFGFNSCYNNDHLNKAGAIHPDCIAKASLKAKTLKRQGRLLLATWHHNTKGVPYANDYMEDTVLKNLIDADFIMGFHGHQHKAEIIREENNVIEQKRMLIFSSGTLCGGPGELPTGHNRQYNVVEIKRNNPESLNITVHSREKTTTSSFDNPIWVKGRIDSTLQSYIEYSLPFEKIEQAIDEVLGKADVMIGKKQFEGALKLLSTLNKEDAFVRKLLLKCYDELEDSKGILKDFNDPKTIEESIYVLNAAIDEQNNEALDLLLKKSIIANTTDPALKEIIKRATI